MYLRVHVHLRLDGRKQRFSNTMMSYITCYKHYACSMQGMLQAVPMPLRMEGMLSNSHHVDGRKTIQIRNVWTRFFLKIEKESPFSKTYGYEWMRPNHYSVVHAGAAGVFGALAYAGFTSAGVSPRNTVLIMNVIPFSLGIR